jgi:diguanylate cyclase (GGDEF)-like protein
MPWTDLLVPCLFVFACCALLGWVAYTLLTRRLRARLVAAQKQLLALRSRDPLTGLVTRAELEGEIKSALDPQTRSAVALALLVLNLDGFRPINEGYGRTVGDAVLAQVGTRLRQGCPGARCIARLDGDEFALLVEADAEAAAKLASTLLLTLREPFAVEKLSLQMGASVGVAVDDRRVAGSRRGRLLADAAQAMRGVKLGGGGAMAFLDMVRGADMRERAELLQDLHHAVERGELELYFQPKIDARSLQVTAAEALLRWQHPKRGLIGPALFVPLAERHGMIDAIGRWVIAEACRQAGIWRERGLRMRVAVNISGHQLRREDLVPFIERCLQRHGIPASRMTCEITESVAMEDTDLTRRAFERLRRAGLHVSIDDFGTGHSSLAALRRLPAAELKIDRAFVTDLDLGETARPIIQAVVQMAHTLGLRVVAEGVETERQRDALVSLGCDELQGYLFAKPMTASALAMWADTDTGSNDSGGPRNSFRASLFDATAPMELGP